MSLWQPDNPLTDPSAGPNLATAATSRAFAEQDRWHNVGEVDEPAFLNGWRSYAPGGGGEQYGPLAFKRSERGVVWIRGAITSDVNMPTDSVICVLPEGYRPPGIFWLFAFDPMAVELNFNAYPEWPPPALVPMTLAADGTLQTKRAWQVLITGPPAGTTANPYIGLGFVNRFYVAEVT